jgi:hypothetical protein
MGPSDSALKLSKLSMITVNKDNKNPFALNKPEQP